ncbi:MBL fold metallo-hydrolase [Providencia vermicola]|uniref:MBL fold metallo-hydrolase n=1 Tax=Providencia vermicola TaxID=333965 RepID=UPI0032DAD0FC
MKIKPLFISLSLAAALFGSSSLANADEIITLGTKGGPSILSETRLPQSTAFIKGDKTYLFDAGYGATLRLVQSKAPLKNIDSIFITHLHSDHVADYPALLLNAWNSGLNHPVTVYGPVGTESMTKGVWDTFKRDIDLRIKDEGKPDLRNMVTAKDVSEGVIVDKDGVKISALFVPHPPFNSDEALAYKIQSEGKTVVITGDMIDNKQIIEFAKDADLLVSEVVLVSGVENLANRIGNGSTLAKAIISHHTTAEEVGKIAKEANVKHLVLTHLVPADDPSITDEVWIKEVRKQYSGPVTVSKDLQRFELK